MKIVLRGHVREVNGPGNGTTDLQLKLDGKIDGDSPNGRDARASLDLAIADRFAKTISLGDEWTVTIVVEPRKE